MYCLQKSLYIYKERFDEVLVDEYQDSNIGKPVPSNPSVMSEEEYIASKGFGFSGIGEPAMHKGKLPGKQQDRLVEYQRQKTKTVCRINGPNFGKNITGR